MSGFPTLLYKEVLRFWKVSFQTVGAPVLQTLLYLVVFAHALADRVQAFPGVTYTQFLVPGLAMMAMLQNAFANSSSSLIQSKITGNIVFILLPPLAPAEIFGAYLLAAMRIRSGRSPSRWWARRCSAPSGSSRESGRRSSTSSRRSRISS